MHAGKYFATIDEKFFDAVMHMDLIIKYRLWQRKGDEFEEFLIKFAYSNVNAIQSMCSSFHGTLTKRK